MATMTGGEAVVRILQSHGVEFAFGMGGFQALPYYDALARQDQVRHVLIRDEKHGAFAADGYARVRNRAAVADGTLGPGATNLISGAAEALGASIPLVLLTGEVNSQMAGRGATQESDQVGMLRPACKASISVSRIDRLTELSRRAFALANGDRPGPVHLNIPEDIFHGRFDFPDHEFCADPAATCVGGRRVRPETSLIDRAAAMIRQADRPVMVIGGGVHLSEAYDELLRFVEISGIPTASTISGKGSISEAHDLALGICGRYSRTANEFIQEADLLLVVGCKLGEIATNRWSIIPSSTKIIQLDIDPAELGKTYRLEAGLWGDARAGLADLTEALRGEATALAERKAAQRRHVQAARATWLARAKEIYQSDEQPVHMARLLNELRQALPPESILVADGGFAAHWSALLFDVTTVGRTYIANRGHAAVGYGLPGALGAKLAAPDRPVVALCGDNGFAMAASELETARRVGANLICVVVNNAALGYVKALQHALYQDRFISVDFEEVDYAGLARSMGVVGMRVETPQDLKKVLSEAMEAQREGPVLLDVRTTTDPAKMLPGTDSRTLPADSQMAD